MRPTPASPLSSHVFPLVRSIVLAVLASGSALADTAPLRATEPSARALAPAAPTEKPTAGMTHGKVLETMNAASYTYARVETPAGEKWIAGPQTAVKVGDMVAWPEGGEMKNFPSKSLGRTFESIFFVGQIVVDGAQGGSVGGSPHGALSGDSVAGPEVKAVVKAEGGVTIAEIYDRRAEFAGKEVVVRGKVVKFNAGVMGRNWVHLRDGSKGADGGNDLTVTSDGEAAVGDTVLVRGKVVLNKDFGFNYRYDVMIEGAKVTVE